MRYLFAVAVAMVTLAGPAYAQLQMQNSSKDPLALKYEREDNESDGPLFFPGEDKQTKLLAQVHEA